MEQPAIYAEGLRKCFGDVQALDGVDVSVPPGTVLGLLGPNGAGKTTAVRILTTILVPDAGRAEVLGVDVVSRPHVVRNVIGLAGQYAAVDENLTGRENLHLMGRLTHQAPAGIAARVDELLTSFSLADAADRPVKTYSGGMRRRLDLAAALVHRPPVLFLDEPTTGLDTRGRSELWSVIEKLVAEGTTLLLTTQYLEEADRLADNIAVVDHGRIIAEGTSEQLKAKLGSTIIRVELTDGARLGEAKGLLADLGQTDIGDDGRSLEVKVADGSAALLTAVRRLDAAGVEPAAIDVREPSLDDVFLTVTGRHVDADAAADANHSRPRRHQHRVEPDGATEGSDR